MKALGTAERPVVFTSASDVKNAGDWSSIVISADSMTSGTVLQNAIIEYTGFSNAGVSIYGGTPRISHTSFQLNNADGIYVEGGATPTIEHCRFENNEGYAIRLDDSLPHFANNSFANDQVIGFNTQLYDRYRQQPITHSGRLEVPGVMDDGRIDPYDLGNCLGIRIINESTPMTLTIEPGVVLQGRVTDHGFSEGVFHNQIAVGKNAALKVSGTAEKPVVFTSAADPGDRNGGQWGGVVFEAGSLASESIIQHAVFEYGGSNWVNTRSNPGWIPGMISIYEGAPSITDSYFRRSNVSGLYLEGSAHPSISDCTLTQNQIGLIFNVTSPLIISDNSIVGNFEYGAFNENGNVIIDMTDNWWGDATGPLDDSDDRGSGGWFNPEGKGDNVSDYIKYKPWLTDAQESIESQTISQILPPSTAIASTIPTIGNCIYFNTDAWTDLSSVFASGTEVFGYTNNRVGGTGYMYLWLSFDSPQPHISLRSYPNGLGPQSDEPNLGDRAELVIEEIHPSRLANRLAADNVPDNLRTQLIGPYIYRLTVTAPDNGYHSSYIFSFDSLPSYAVGKGKVDDLDWEGRVRVCRLSSDVGESSGEDGALASMDPTAVSLSGKWDCDDGGEYYLRQIDSTLWWYGESNSNNPRWSNVAKGIISGDMVHLDWADVPKGGVTSSGIMTLKILSNDELQATEKTGGFAGSRWKRSA